MEPWEGVVQIPEGKVGTYAIEHFTRPAGKVERSNMRTAFMGGQADKPLTFDRETNWHRLSYDGGVWMTDLPIEQAQHDGELEPIQYGRVLVGGLGIGYAANLLASREDIEEVVVVEISSEVCELVGSHVIDPDNKVKIVNADLFEFLKGLEEEDYFDYAFYDIWQSDGEGTFFKVVCPLREASWDYIDDENIICWNENVMRGQLSQSIQSNVHLLGMKLPNGEVITVKLLAEQKGDIWWDWSSPFWEAVKNGVIPLEPNEEFMRRVGEYAGAYGRSGWKIWWEMVKEGKA